MKELLPAVLRQLCVVLLVIFFVPLTLPPQAVEARGKKASTKKFYRKKTRRVKRSYRVSRSAFISQRYSLEEGMDSGGAGTISNELLDLGAENASVDINKNLVDVKFKTSRLSSIAILSKLKELGYTVKRID